MLTFVGMTISRFVMSGLTRHPGPNTPEPMERQPAVYIVASRRNGTIYTGVTSDLIRRIFQHRSKSFASFTASHDVHRLVWFEMHETMESAILREKRIKNWRREWKLALIEADNSRWRDLSVDLGFDEIGEGG